MKEFDRSSKLREKAGLLALQTLLLSAIQKGIGPDGKFHPERAKDEREVIFYAAEDTLGKILDLRWDEYSSAETDENWRRVALVGLALNFILRAHIELLGGELPQREYYFP